MPHFQGADDAANVVGVQPGGADRVHVGQPSVQGGRTETLGLVGEPAAQVLIGRRPVEQAVQDRLEI